MGPGTLSVEECLRLDEVARWGIVSTSRPQSVAGHTAVVAHLALNIARAIGVCQDPESQMHIMRYALFHDVAEIHTGDIPAPAKQYMDDGSLESAEGFMCPVQGEVAAGTPVHIRSLVKVADAWEGYAFAVYYTQGPQVPRVVEFMRRYLVDKVEDFASRIWEYSPAYEGVDAGSVADSILNYLRGSIPGVKTNAD